jgi:hypothetical protein
MLYGFICVTNKSLINLRFLASFFTLKIALLYNGFKLAKKHIQFSELVFFILLIDILSLIAYVFGAIFYSYYRFLYFASTPNFSLSYILFNHYLIIPIMLSLFTILSGYKIFSPKPFKEVFEKLSYLILNIFFWNNLMLIMFK